jgi:tetratricopeptide (TPR) repeat protein
MIVVAYLSRAQAYAEAGRGAQATADYQTAIDMTSRQLERSPENARLLYWRAIARHAMGQSRQALADYDASISADSRNPFAYTNRGILLAVHYGQHERAVQDFDRALALAPRDPDALFNRAIARIRLQQFDGAIEDLDAAIAVRPDDPLAHYNRGHVYLVRGKYEEAIRDYAAALERRPDLAEARLGLCRATLLTGAAPGSACPVADQSNSPRQLARLDSPPEVSSDAAPDRSTVLPKKVLS